jgi:hypothetical protein
MKARSPRRIAARIKTVLAQTSAVARTLKDVTGLSIESAHVENALMDVLSLRDSVDLIDIDLTEERMIAMLKDYDFRRFFPVVIGKMNFRRSIIPRSVPRFLFEARVRRNGEVWEFHKNDADPFPSNPHGHNMKNRLKLHLGTGELFKKKQRMGKISRKDLIAIREALWGFDLPPLTRQ